MDKLVTHRSLLNTANIWVRNLNELMVRDNVSCFDLFHRAELFGNVCHIRVDLDACSISDTTVVLVSSSHSLVVTFDHHVSLWVVVL